MKKQNGANLYIPVFVGVIVLVFVLNFAMNLNNVQGSMDTPDKLYKTVIVYKDDTLWEIADNHMNRDYYNYDSYIDEVISINNIQGTKIYAGEELIVPVID